MPRIPEANRRYRSRRQICEDIAVILDAPISFGTKFAVLAEVVWVWSEFDGKLNGCQYWSEKALALEHDRRKLIHEHLVPKRIIIERLFALKRPTSASVRRILNKYCIGVVVTREEDAALTRLGLRSAMPKEWDGVDPWARYNAARITVPVRSDSNVA